MLVKAIVVLAFAALGALLALTVMPKPTNPDAKDNSVARGGLAAGLAAAGAIAGALLMHYGSSTVVAAKPIAVTSDTHLPVTGTVLDEPAPPAAATTELPLPPS